MRSAPENRWVTVAKLLLRTTYPEREYDFVDEWPTVDARSNLFRPQTDCRLRADIGILPKSRPEYSRSLDDLVAIVEIGDLSSARKLEQWESALPDGVRVIWIPKLDLLDAVHPGFNRFRFQPPKITKDDVFAELARQLGEIAKAKAEADAATKIVHATITEQQRAMREIHRCVKDIAIAVDAIGDAIDPEKWDRILERT